MRVDRWIFRSREAAVGFFACVCCFISRALAAFFWSCASVRRSVDLLLYARVRGVIPAPGVVGGLVAAARRVLDVSPLAFGVGW